MNSDLLGRFPVLRNLENPAIGILDQSSRVVRLPPGAKAFESGMQCDNYLMVASGRIRVQQVSESGREIVLYRIGDGESCVLTTACLLAHERYSAEAITETEVSALVVPRISFERLVAESQRFRDFVFMAYASRITDLMLLVEEIAFGHIDIRLAQRLLELTDRVDSLSLTHHELSVELGTAREVISRQLKEFERRGWIRLERGRIVIRDRGAVSNLAGLRQL